MFKLNRRPIRRRPRLILEELEARTLLSASGLDNLLTAQPFALAQASQADVSITPDKPPNGGGSGHGGHGGGGVTNPNPLGYSPGQIQNAYGFNQIYSSGLNGANQTIAIVDAYNDPNIQ